MAHFVIGDVQGCYDPLMALLEQVRFDEAGDTLWFTGDLVNRGSKSLEVLRFVKQLPNVVTVLGNHDLHLLAIRYGGVKQSKGDTLAPILNAPDSDELLQWLRFRPLMHREADKNILLIHAGLAPQWSANQAAELAHEVEIALQDTNFKQFLKRMYGNQPDIWHDSLQGLERLRFAINCFTRLRYLDKDGRLLLRAKGPIGSQSTAAIPWFQANNRQSTDQTVFFGHWSALGLYQNDHVVALDTGCVWGESLTAVELDEMGGVVRVHQRACR